MTIIVAKFVLLFQSKCQSETMIKMKTIGTSLYQHAYHNFKILSLNFSMTLIFICIYV